MAAGAGSGKRAMAGHICSQGGDQRAGFSFQTFEELKDLKKEERSVANDSGLCS